MVEKVKQHGAKLSTGVFSAPNLYCVYIRKEPWGGGKSRNENYDKVDDLTMNFEREGNFPQS